MEVDVGGTGTAAMVASQQTASGGWKFALIDFRPFGGTLAFHGCDPKKALIGGEIRWHVRRQIDMGFKRTAKQNTAPIPKMTKAVPRLNIKTIAVASSA